MAINYDVWGQPETWVDGTSTEQNAEIKFPMSTREDYQKLWDNGFLTLNNIDTSEFFYGIGKECIWCHPRYLYCYKDGGSAKYGEKEVLEDIRDRPIMFSNNSSSTVYSSYSRRYKYGRTTTPIGNMYAADVVISFNYQKLMLIPFVSCVAENASTTVTATTTSLYDYIENQTYLTKPWIVAIGYKMRYGEGGETNRTSPASGFTPLFDYQIMPYTVLTESNYFWASAFGCGMLRDSSVTSGTGMGKPCGAPRSRYSVNNDSIDDYTGFANRYCVGEGSSVDMFYYDDMWSINIYDGTGTTYWAPYPYLDVVAENADIIKNYVLKQIAFLGLPFVYDPDNAARGQIGNIGVYLPVFDEYGVTTGEYKEGDQALTLPNAQWTDSRSAGYDPDRPSDTDDIGDLYNTGSKRFFYNSLNVHLMSVANYYQFIQKLNALNMTDPDNETWQLQFKGLNPSDYIVGAYVSFVKPPKGNSSSIMLGPVDMNQSEYTYAETSDNAGFFTFGTKPINAFYHDFRDYEPYTKIEVYLPLCGSIELETAYFMEASLKIDYYYDIYTMSCTACLYRVKAGEELLYKTINGSIGAQIPMLSANMGAYQNQIKSIENAMKQNNLKLMTSTAALAAGVIAAPMTSGTSLIAAGTAALSGTAGIASSLQKQAELDYQIEHLQPSISITGAADPQLSLCEGQLMPKLIIKRPKMTTDYDQTIYAQTIGNACCINDILGYIEGDSESPREGLVVCSSVDTSGISQLIDTDTYISPTAEEVNMIKQALSAGVIL